jgi:ArsR family transcriptional regulator
MYSDPLNAAEFFQALSDDTRLRCIVLLAGAEELCVCELTNALELPQPKISRHLAVLRANDIVQDRKTGLWVYYRLHSTMPAWKAAVVNHIAAAFKFHPVYKDDRKRLEAMPSPPEKANPSPRESRLYTSLGAT